MSDKTGIEWTDATWNPVTGCTKVSAGCDHCYAETIAHRFAGTKAYPDGFQVTLRPERIDQPLRWTKPRRIFVNSMADLFHDDVSDHYIATVFAVMALAPHHTFQVLTKRHGRMRSLLSSASFRDEVYLAIRATVSGGASKVPVGIQRDMMRRATLGTPLTVWPLPNVWLGVSVENQQWADIRIPALLDTPGAVRFLSCEPLLGPIDLNGWLVAPNCDDDGQCPCGDDWTRLDWVIVGGESGPGARPMHPNWARTLRDQCQTAGVAYLHKQWGEWSPVRPANWRDYRDDRRDTFRPDGTRYRVTEPDMLLDPAMATMFRVGKKAAGRQLDGRTWDQYPPANPTSEHQS